MACTTLHDQFNIAAPRLNAERDRRAPGLFAGSVPPQPRRVRVRRLPSAAESFRWLRGFASLAQWRSQRMFSVVTPVARTARGDDGPSMRDGLDALARVNAAVRAGQLVADPRRSRGDLRPT